jgi:hypothetical protein
MTLFAMASSNSEGIILLSRLEGYRHRFASLGFDLSGVLLEVDLSLNVSLSARIQCSDYILSDGAGTRARSIIWADILWCSSSVITTSMAPVNSRRSRILRRAF